MSIEERNRRPANTAFKQQRLKAWQPLLTPKTVLPTLFVAGIIFAPLGGVFLYESDTVNEIVIDYTNCMHANSTAVSLDTHLYSYKFTDEGSGQLYAPTYRFEPSTVEGEAGHCLIRFSVPIQLKTPIFLYYKLTNFYQNHRKYVKSLSYNQLHGDVITQADAASSCSPLGVDANNKIYYPCGLIANSMFNDTFEVTFINPPGSTTSAKMGFSSEGIAWPSDKKRLATTQMNPADLVPPPNWQKKYPNGYTAENIFKPQEDEHFQVWMRTSWYPTFRKLYSALREGTLEAGTYEVNVTLNYDITAYGGTKSIVVTGTSFLGDRNPFMGLSWIVMGCVCTLLGVIFLGWHFFKPR
ncbi:CDC50/LEM3 family [Mycotypha africana]|uniref:CDC50/LEM3 family n=1 Tax=Mycotypha africana TaxID=64632 RepID=UPI002301D0BD|nr:CDC50/LEM3 family [Mycotypha africana]KAI8979586.1 CDC50/LEM3 family [Mycotypha africana]